ncbi:MAG: MoaD/ThiS family protein [Chloroflexi bacterium]|nr:MoaD/ThiS family protein [Chloroflexota bacterium]
MPTLRIPSPLRPFADGASEIDVQGSTVSDALEELTVKYPSLRKHLFTEDGEMRAFVNLFLNDEDVRFLQGVDTKINVDDRLMIIPSIAGGGLG